MRHSAVIAAALVAVVLTGCSDTTSEPTATYDGSGCSYEGPTEFDLDSTVTFTFINESDTASMGFAVWSVPEGTTADDILEEGIFVVIGGGPSVDPEKGFYAASFAPTAVDSTEILTVTLDRPGQHALNCYDESPDGGDHTIMFTVSDN